MQSTSVRSALDAGTEKHANGCWLWTGPVNAGGYGIVKWRHLAHRLAWSIANDADPGRDIVCHHCDNRRCVNPAHLYLGTPKSNTQDAIKRGRHTRPDAATFRRLEAIARRQIRRDEWDYANSPEPSDFLGLSIG